VNLPASATPKPLQRSVPSAASSHRPVSRPGPQRGRRNQC
jgi:hypothetical protein